MNKIILLSLMLTTVGCASQPSNYSDTSTHEQRNVQATGRAATEAAKSNTSTNADVRQDVKVTQPVNPHGFIVYDANGKRDHRAELRLLQQKSQYRKPGYGSYYLTNTKREFDYEMRRKMDKSIDRLMDKIF